MHPSSNSAMAPLPQGPGSLYPLTYSPSQRGTRTCQPVSAAPFIATLSTSCAAFPVPECLPLGRGHQSPSRLKYKRKLVGHHLWAYLKARDLSGMGQQSCLLLELAHHVDGSPAAHRPPAHSLQP